MRPDASETNNQVFARTTFTITSTPVPVEKELIGFGTALLDVVGLGEDFTVGDAEGEALVEGEADAEGETLVEGDADAVSVAVVEGDADADGERVVEGDGVGNVEIPNRGLLIELSELFEIII